MLQEAVIQVYERDGGGTSRTTWPGAPVSGEPQIFGFRVANLCREIR